MSVSCTLHDIPCHQKIRAPQGSFVVCKNDVTRIWLIWLYRGLASYEQDECLHITFHMIQHGTRENVSYDLCCAAKLYKQKRLIWFSHGVTVLLLEHRTHDVTCRNMHISLSTACAVHQNNIASKRLTCLHHEKRGFLQLPRGKKTCGEGKCLFRSGNLK